MVHGFLVSGRPYLSLIENSLSWLDGMEPVWYKLGGFWIYYGGVLVGTMDNISTLTRLSAAQRIARLLKEGIERQEYQPGEWLPTERELARQFNADRATIRTAIAQLAEQNLVVREAGRRPWVNGPSRSSAPPPEERLPLKALKTIAAIIPQPPLYPALATIQRGILRELRQGKPEYRLIVFDNQGEIGTQSIALERQALEAVENDGITGVILWQLGGEETMPILRRLQAKGVSLVLLDRRPDDFSCDFVGIDNRSAAREAVSYLLKLGHRRIAHLTSAKGILTVREREEGYREALASYGIPIEEELIFRIEEQDDLTSDVKPVVERLLSLPEPPTALFVLKDLLAHAVLCDLRARGQAVPGKLSIVGFDDHDRYALQPPELTTVHQPFEDMGQHAARLLLRRLAGSTTPLPHQHLLLPTPLVVRSTCQRLG